MSSSESEAESNELQRRGKSDSKAKKYPPLLDGKKYYRVDKQENDHISAVCLPCETLSKKPGNSKMKITFEGLLSTTSNFTVHLLRKHKDLHDQYHYENPPKRRKLDYGKFELINLKEKQEMNDQILFNLIVKNFLPPSTVTNEDLIALVQNLNKLIVVIDSNKLYLDVVRAGNRIRQNHRTKFNDISDLSFAAIAIQMNNITFILIACFWLHTANLSRQDAVLRCTIANTESTLDSEYVWNIVSDVMLEYDIPDNKVSSVVVNDAVQCTEDVAKFINNTNAFERSETYDDDLKTTLVYYPVVNVLDGQNNKVCHSISYQIIKYATSDFLLLLKTENKLDFHNGIFSKLNNIWNVALKNPQTIQSFCQMQIIVPGNDINSIYKAIVSILQIQSQIPVLATQFQSISELTERELTYLRDITNYLKIITEAIEAVNGDSNGYYGNAAPILFSLLEKLQYELNWAQSTELDFIHMSLIDKFKIKFSKYLEFNEENSAIFAACFHPEYKDKWLPLEEKLNTDVREMCVRKISAAMPPASILTRRRQVATDNPGKSKFVIMRPEIDRTDNDGALIQLLKYLKEPFDENMMLNRFPTIKKLFMKYNTPNCNSDIVKEVINRTNILKIIDSKLTMPELINHYSIINADVP